MRAICRDTRLCAGCTACANICPQKCIEMIENEEGFLYPQVDESRCVNCNLCEKTCPINTMPKINQANPKTRVARTLDNKLLEQCSSGGVFTTLAKTFIESNGVVYGVIYDTNFNGKISWFKICSKLFRRCISTNKGRSFKRKTCFILRNPMPSCRTKKLFKKRLCGFILR